MKKGIISLLLVTALLFTFAVPSFAADEYVKTVYFDLDYGRYAVGSTISSDGVIVEASRNYNQYPGFSISNYYQEMLQSTKDAEAKKYLQEKVQGPYP